MEDNNGGLSYAKLMSTPSEKKESKKYASVPVHQAGSMPTKNTPKKSDRVETIRSTVKTKGYVSFNARITSSENDKLEDAIYSIKKMGLRGADKTSLTRIALAFLLEDFEERGEEGIFVKVLESLNA